MFDVIEGQLSPTIAIFFSNAITSSLFSSLGSVKSEAIMVRVTVL